MWFQVFPPNSLGILVDRVAESFSFAVLVASPSVNEAGLRNGERVTVTATNVCEFCKFFVIRDYLFG